MKFLNILTLIIFFSLSVNIAKSQTKHAIVVAIGDYPADEKGQPIWNDLSSLNDVELVRAMLKAQQFEDKNCSYLIDQKATPENLNKTFDELLEKLKEGDIVYFHYSGHGQQVADIKPKKRKDIVGGDESDHYDEALVLYNAPMKFDKIKDYEMEHHYVDDQMKFQFDKIRKKIGSDGQVVLVVDACHSGSSNRGSDESVVRGTTDVCAPANWKAGQVSDTTEGFGTDFYFDNNPKNGKMIAFYGCKADQVNSEITPDGSPFRYGSLTYFFINAMTKLAEKASYSNLFSEIRKNMLLSFNGKQIPEIDGDNLNLGLFSNTFIPAKPFYLVESIFADEVNINAGILNGIENGDIIGLFATDVSNPREAKSLYEGSVKEVSAQKATLKMTAVLEGSNKNPGLYRAFLMKKGNGGADIKVKFELKKHKKEIEKRIENMSNIIVSKRDYDFKVKELDNGKVIIFVGPDENMPLREMNPMTISGDEQYDSLMIFLKQTAQVELLRKISCQNPNLDFEVNWKIGNGHDVIEGESYTLEIKNTGNEDFFFQVVEIEPNLELTPINNPNFKFRLVAGKNKNISLKFSADPAGLDQLLFIASPESINLSGLETIGSKIETRDAGMPELVNFINLAASGSRGASFDGSELTIKSITFEIKKKK